MAESNNDFIINARTNLDTVISQINTAIARLSALEQMSASIKIQGGAIQGPASISNASTASNVTRDIAEVEKLEKAWTRSLQIVERVQKAKEKLSSFTKIKTDILALPQDDDEKMQGLRGVAGRIANEERNLEAFTLLLARKKKLFQEYNQLDRVTELDDRVNGRSVRTVAVDPNQLRRGTGTEQDYVRPKRADGVPAAVHRANILGELSNRGLTVDDLRGNKSEISRIAFGKDSSDISGTQREAINSLLARGPVASSVQSAQIKADVVQVVSNAGSAPLASELAAERVAPRKRLIGDVMQEGGGDGDEFDTGLNAAGLRAQRMAMQRDAQLAYKNNVAGALDKGAEKEAMDRDAQLAYKQKVGGAVAKSNKAAAEEDAATRLAISKRTMTAKEAELAEEARITKEYEKQQIEASKLLALEEKRLNITKQGVGNAFSQNSQEHGRALQMNESRDRQMGIAHVQAIQEDERRSAPGGLSYGEGATRRVLVYSALGSALYASIAAVKQFVTVTIDLDTKMAELRRTLAGTDEDFAKLTQSAIAISKSTKTPLLDVLDTMKQFSGEFKGAGQLEELAKASALLANVMGVSTSEAVKTLTATLKEYDSSAAESAHITDAWANVTANSRATGKDLADGIATAGAAAKVAGVDFDHLNGMIASVANSTGKSGESIGTAFKRMFERSTSDDGAKKLQDLGVYVYKANGQFRDFGNVLSDVHGRWDKLNDTQQKNIAIAFAGARNYDTFLALMKNWKDTVRLTEDSINSFGAAEQNNSDVTDTFAKKAQMVGNEFTIMANNARGGLIPVFSTLADMVTKLLEGFNALPGSMQLVVAGFAAFAGANAASKLKFFGGTSLASRVGSGLRGLGNAGIGLATGATGEEAAALGMTQLSTETFLLVAGFASLAAILATIALAGWGVYEIWDAMRYKGAEMMSANSRTAQKDTQESAQYLGYHDQLKTLVSERQKEEKNGGISRETQRNTSALLRDISNSKQKYSGQVASRGLFEDESGNFQSTKGDMTDALNKLAGDAGADSEISAAEARKWFERNIGTDGEFGRQNDKIFDRSGDAFTAKGNSKGYEKNVLDFFENNQSVTDQGVLQDKFKQQFGGSLNSYSSKEGLDPEQYALRAFKDAKQAFDDAEKIKVNFKQHLDSYIATLKGKGDSADTINNSKKTLINSYTAGMFNEGGIDFLRDLHDSDVVDRKDDSRKRINKNEETLNLKEHDLPRIDLELNKSLVDNSREYETFGAGVNFMQNAVSAYKRAIEDMLTSTSKAAGPKEEAGFKANAEAIDKEKAALQKMHEERKSAKDDDEDANRIRGLTIEKYKAEQQGHLDNIQALKDEKDAIVAINPERQKALDILTSQYNVLQSISDMGDIIKGPVSSAMSSFGKDNENAIMGKNDLQAQMSYAQQQLSYDQRQPYSQGQASSIFQANEQIKAINYQMDELNRKTNIWYNLLDNIGNSALKSISDKFTNYLTEGLDSFAAGGKATSNSLFGSANKNQDLMDNTMALRELSGALLGARAGLGTKVGGSATDIDPITGLAVGAKTGDSDDAKTPKTIPNAPTPKDVQSMSVGQGIQAAIMGAGIGQAITQSQAKQGYGGTAGGALGGVLGGIAGTAFGGNTMIGASLGSLAGGWLGSFFDQDIKPLQKSFDDLSNQLIALNTTIDKNTKTINDVMGTVINAPSNFVLPIPKGIMENSVTAQSAIATPMQAGGLVLRSGPAFLHTGERVNPAGQGMGGVHNYDIDINVNGANSNPQEIAAQVSSELNKTYAYQSQRVGSYARRF